VRKVIFNQQSKIINHPSGVSMTETNQAQDKQITANGVELFCQVRGRGPALLLIPSIGGDSGEFDVLAEKLADQYQVITYDLRGHSRSNRQPDWHKTSMAEQAGDAAALLKELGIRSTTVFGSGVGGLIALELMQSYPKLVRKALLHDPLIYAALENGPYKNVSWDVGNLVRSTFVRQGHTATLTAILRWEYGAELVANINGEVMLRMLTNSETFMMVDFPAYAIYYKPDEAKLAAIKTPAKILFSTSSYPWRREMCAWLGERMHASVEPFLGEHAPYFNHPMEMADALRLHL
jgi:pimeloyl-ACP methyl ester carboxylesterase